MWYTGLVTLPGMWDLLGSGIEPMPPASAGGFFISEPPGKPHLHFKFLFFNVMYFLIEE